MDSQALTVTRRWSEGTESLRTASTRASRDYSEFGVVSRGRMAKELTPLVDTQISVITNDGRNIIGILRGFDQTTNLILEECFERVYSEDSGVEQAVLGLYIIRGDNM